MVRSFPADPSSIRAAREFVGDLLADEHRRAAALLLTSELATNALIHVGCEFTVTVYPGHPARVEVADSATALPVARHPTPADEHGRGLALLAALASAWGAEPYGTGKIVWFELA